jgi:hypothetical protein
MTKRSADEMAVLPTIPTEIRHYILCCLPAPVFKSLKLSEDYWRVKVQHDYPWSFAWFRDSKIEQFSAWWKFLHNHNMPPKIGPGVKSWCNGQLIAHHPKVHNSEHIFFYPAIFEDAKWLFLPHDDDETQRVVMKLWKNIGGADTGLGVWISSGYWLVFGKNTHHNFDTFKRQNGLEHFPFHSSTDEWREFLQPHHIFKWHENVENAIYQPGSNIQYKCSFS